MKKKREERRVMHMHCGALVYKGMLECVLCCAVLCCAKEKKKLLVLFWRKVRYGRIRFFLAVPSC